MGFKRVNKMNTLDSDALHALHQCARDAQAWLVERALPFWAQNATGSDGGFCEELTRTGEPNWQAIRRVRVQARQIYTYSLAHKNGWFNGLGTANNTLNFMLEKGFMVDGEPGFASLLNPNLSVNDHRRDLYDHAFYLLSLAWHYRITGQRSSLALADSVLGFLDRELGADNGGFLEGLPAGDPRNALRRQNPHMHLFEAFMALYDATHQDKYLHRARDIFALFHQHFMDADTGTITEFFHRGWTPARGTQGKSVEPGHMAEWVWLLGQYQSRTGVNTRPWADKLYKKVNGYTSRDASLLIDEMDKTGKPIRATKRLWVQTEFVKAHLAQAEFGAPSQRSYAYSKAAQTLSAIQTQYLRPNGTWIDQLGENGLPVLGAIPTSTFYHIICMISESCRAVGLLDTYNAQKPDDVKSTKKGGIRARKMAHKHG